MKLALCFLFLYCASHTLPLLADDSHPAFDTAEEIQVEFKDSETEHFKLYSQKSIDESDYRKIRQYLKEVRRGAAEYLNLHPDEDFEVILSEPEVFRGYTGSGVHVAGMFDGRIHLPIPSEVESEEFLKSVLWHEYGHAMVYSLTKGETLVWINEGVATYLQSQIESRDVSYIEELVDNEKRLPYSLDEMEMIFRSSKQQSVNLVLIAYSQAFVTAHYLFKKEPEHEVKQLLKKAGKMPIDEALRVSLNLTESELMRRVVRHVERTSW